MLIASLALILCVGMVSAVVLTYYGKIIATVNVAQAVVLDGKPYPNYDISETASGTAGSTFYGDYHWLRNYADTRILVDLVSTSESAYPAYVLVPTIDGISGVSGDEDAVHFYFTPMTWSAFTSVSFDYNIVSGPSSRVPHVNMLLRYEGQPLAQVTTWNGGAPPAEIVGNTATYTKDKFTLLDGTPVSGYDSWEVWEVTIESGNPSIDPSHDTDLQVVYVSNAEVNGAPLTWIILPLQSNFNVPTRTIDFRMAYYFAPNVVLESFGIDTTVEYKGTISGSGVIGP
jgi:hypothetical protein